MAAATSIRFLTYALVLFFLSANPAFAQDNESAVEADPGIGGPQTIGAQLEIDNTPGGYRFPVVVFADWFKQKQRVNDEYGIGYNINYTTLATWASEKSAPENDDFAASGIFNALFSWSAIGSAEEGNVGRLFAKLDWRHKFTDTAPHFLSFEAGYNSLAAVGFKDYTPRLQELNWAQAFANNRFHVIAGKVDPPNYFTFHRAEVPWTDFLGYGFSVNGTVNWADPGLGVIGSVRPTENFYITAALSDAQGDRFEDGEILCCYENFLDGKFFKAVEVGYVPSFAERFIKKLSFTWWETDEYEIDDGDPSATPPVAPAISPKASGWAFTANWTFNDWITPFLTYGNGDGVGANVFYEESISAGATFYFKNYDVLGVGYNHSRVAAEAGLPDQDVIEVYYRFMLTEHLEFSPDVQYVMNPTLDPNIDSLWYFQLRLRLTF